MNKNIQTLVTYLFLVPLVYYIPPTINNLIRIPKFLNVGLSVGIIVLLMSYLIMPLFTKALLCFGTKQEAPHRLKDGEE